MAFPKLEEVLGGHQENMDVLWAEMSVLKHLRDDVVRRGERNMDKWLQNVESQEREVAKLRKELHEIRKGSRPNISEYKLELHKKVIEILGVVADLKREGNCNVVAHRVGAAAFLEGNNLMGTVLGNSSETVEKFLSHMAREKPLRFSSTQLKSFTSNFSRHLGSGGYGEVYKGRFPNGIQLAVKVLKDNVKDVKRQFMAEVSTMGRTYHRNLVRLYGYCFDDKLKALVYEFVENGSLDKIIYENRLQIEWEKLYDIATETAKGLAYLHENCHKRIIHCDIKAGNVLIDANLCPKVADFGLAKLYNRDSSHVTLTKFRGTPDYAAPEMWMPCPVSYKCDVYSFGMMSFEILGRKKNCNRRLGEGQKWFPRHVWEKFEKGQLEEVIRDCGIEEKDREKAKILCIVALWCSQYLAQDRPSMSTVVKVLEGEIQAMDPPNPFPYMAASSVASTITTKSTRTISSVVSSESDTTGYRDSTRTPIRVPVELSFSPVSPEVSPAFAGWQIEPPSLIQKLTIEVQENNTVTKMAEPEEKKDEVITVVLMVYMHCEACAQEVKKYLGKMKGVQTASADLDRSQITVKGIIDPVVLVEYIYKKTNKRAMIVKIESERKEEEKVITEAEQWRKPEAKDVTGIKKEKKTTRHGVTVKNALPKEEEEKVIEKIELKKKQEEEIAVTKVEKKPSKRVTIGKSETEKKQEEKVIEKTEPQKNEEELGYAKTKLEKKREKKEEVGFVRTKSMKKKEEKKDGMMGPVTQKHATGTKVRKEQDMDASKIEWEVKKEESDPVRIKPPLKEEETYTAKSKPVKEEDNFMGKNEEIRKDREKITEVVERGKIWPEMKEKRQGEKADDNTLLQKAVNNKGNQKEEKTETNTAKVKPIEEEGTEVETERKEYVFYGDIPRYPHLYYNPAPQMFSDENPNAWCSIQ